jgi:uncharacterized protein YbbK (DUF523 family)
MFMQKILISACLLGRPVRYDGRSVPKADPMIRKWLAQGRLVFFCPEVAGGLPVPRPPAEVQGGSGLDVLAGRAVVRTQTADVTHAFLAGARAALDLCQAQGISLALLKEKSPSCGSRHIYDGGFHKKLIPGRGVTAALLETHEITVFSEDRVPDLACLLG